MLSSIFWDPDPNVFIIPYLDHPLKWYGLLFMSGMVAGFFILYFLLKEKLKSNKQLQERDVASWNALQQALLLSNNSESPKGSDTPLSTTALHTALHLDKSTYQQLQHLQQSQQKNPPLELPEATKKKVLNSLSTIDRSQLEKLLPEAIVPLKELSYKYVDSLMWWFVLGTVIGARLGHVFFYDWAYYRHNIGSIFKVWEGGLASHGGTVGILLVIYFYSRLTRKKFPELSFLALLDLLAIPVSFGVIFIRLGNFVNQEILGTPSSLPWAVVFGHPIDGGPIAPRHPVQLYEAVAYFLTFVLLATLWKLKKGKWAEGFMVGLLFVCIFGSRFILEFFKASQTAPAPDGSFLEIGQLLSIPFILLGVALIYFSQMRSNHDFNKRQSEH